MMPMFMVHDAAGAAVAAKANATGHYVEGGGDAAKGG